MQPEGEDESDKHTRREQRIVVIERSILLSSYRTSQFKFVL